MFGNKNYVITWRTHLLEFPPFVTIIAALKIPQHAPLCCSPYRLSPVPFLSFSPSSFFYFPVISISMKTSKVNWMNTKTKQKCLRFRFQTKEKGDPKNLESFSCHQLLWQPKFLENKNKSTEWWLSEIVDIPSVISFVKSSSCNSTVSQSSYFALNQ